MDIEKTMNLFTEITSREPAYGEGMIMFRFAEAVVASEREAHDYTKGKLAGALAALRQLQECVPPKEWKRYASEVLALGARDRKRSNDQNQRPGGGLQPEGRAGSPS